MTIKSMVSDELDTIGIMKCHNKVHQKYSSIYISNHLSHLHKLWAQLFLTPSQFLLKVTKLAMTGSSLGSQAFIPGKALSLMSNQSLSKVIGQT
jgi:hypothetical protein